MKNLFTLLLAFSSISFSYSQLIDYYIEPGSMVGLTMTSGDVCTPPWVAGPPQELKQSSLGNTWGGAWTSTGAGTPSSVTLTLYWTINDADGPYTVLLNGSAAGTSTPGFIDCGGPVVETISLDPSFYNDGAGNAFSINYAASDTINQLDHNPFAFPYAYAHLEVDYSPACNDPTVPTLTATPSTICPGASTTIDISGTLNDATQWEVYTVSCGGTSDGSTMTSTYDVSPASTTTYYIRGEGGCVTPGSCASITITVEDVTGPVPDVAVLPTLTDECSVTPTPPTATDDCEGAITGTTTTVFPITTQGTTTVTWTYDDGNGNITTQDQIVVIDDVTPPIFGGCPMDIDVTADNAGCTSIVTWIEPVATDNCVGWVVTSTHNPPFTFPLGTTTVTYTVTDVGGNTAECSFDVNVTSDLTVVEDSIHHVDCFGDGDGAVYIGVSGTNTPFTFSWSPGGETSEDITGLDGGVYSVTVTDAAGCTSGGVYTVAEPGSALDVVLDGSTNPTSCGASDGTVDVTTSGGTPAYDFSWNSGAYTTEDLSAVPAGSYELIVTDAGGCTDTVNVVLSDPGAPAVTENTVTHVTCCGGSDGALDIDVTGGTSPYTFDWDYDGTGDFDDPEDPTGLPAGVYSVTVLDDAGCAGVLVLTITEPPCLDTSVTVSGTDLMSNATGVTYQWIDCATGTPITGETSATFSPTANGSYAVIVSDGTCQDTSSCYDITSLMIKELENELQISIYPNPSSGQFNIEAINALGKVEISIYSTEGKLVFSEEQELSKGDAISIDISDQAAGTYSLHIATDDSKSQVTLILE